MLRTSALSYMATASKLGAIIVSLVNVGLTPSEGVERPLPVEVKAASSVKKDLAKLGGLNVTSLMKVFPRVHIPPFKNPFLITDTLRSCEFNMHCISASCRMSVIFSHLSPTATRN